VALTYEHSEYKNQLERKRSLHLYLIVWLRNKMYTLVIAIAAAVLLLGIGKILFTLTAVYVINKCSFQTMPL
jgi:hypothetical protein